MQSTLQCLLFINALRCIRVKQKAAGWLGFKPCDRSCHYKGAGWAEGKPPPARGTPRWLQVPGGCRCCCSGAEGKEEVAASSLLAAPAAQVAFSYAGEGCGGCLSTFMF